MSPPEGAYFESIKTDLDGNIYVVGSVYSTDPCDFGNGVSISGGNSDGSAFIVKYDTNGNALWARTAEIAPNASWFMKLVTDDLGNIYVSGVITSNEEFDFGDGVTVSGNSTQQNAVLLKFSSSGHAEWALTPSSASNTSRFNGIAVSKSGDIYVAGEVWYTGEFNFGNNVSLSGTGTGVSPFLMKYNSSGVAQWIKSASGTYDFCQFRDMVMSESGDVYAVGINRGIETDFSGGITLSSDAVYNNSFIIKYDSLGQAEWAKSTINSPDHSGFNSIDMDRNGDIYVAGYASSTGEFDFGDGVTVQGGGDSNALIVKYSPTGNALWARVNLSPAYWGEFCDVAVDASSNIYAAGEMETDSQFDFGNGATATGGGDYNALLVSYNSEGDVQWIKTTPTAPDYTEFYGVDADNHGDVYAVGEIDTTGEYDFGNEVKISGSSDTVSPVIVKYKGVAPDPPVFDAVTSDSRPINIDEGQVITSNPYIIWVKPSSPVGISKVEFYVDDVLIGTDTTADADGIYSFPWDTSRYHSVVKIVAYDVNNNTVTMIRNTTVNLNVVSLTQLPETGADSF